MNRGLRSAILSLSKGNEHDIKRGEKIKSWLDQASARSDTFFDYASIFLTDLNKPNFNIRKTLITKVAKKNAPNAAKILFDEGGRLQRIISRWRAVNISESTSSLLVLWEALLTNYQAQKNAKSLVDYDDLILMAIRIRSS